VCQEFWVLVAQLSRFFGVGVYSVQPFFACQTIDNKRCALAVVAAVLLQCQHGSKCKYGNHCSQGRRIIPLQILAGVIFPDLECYGYLLHFRSECPWAHACCCKVVSARSC